MKQDPPQLKFSREAGECARVDEEAISDKTNRGTVANAAECESICQNFHATCKGFSFESQFNTCHTFETGAHVLKGDLTTERVCNIRLTEEEVAKYYGPEIIATPETGECRTKDGELAPTYASVTTSKTPK